MDKENGTSAVRDVNGAILNDSPEIETEVEEGEEVTEEKPKSVREALESAYDESISKEEPEKKVRDESGKFTGKSKEKEVSKDSVKELTPPIQTSTEEYSNILRSLTEPDQQVFKSSPPELQKAFAKMADGAFKASSRKLAELGVKERKYRELDDAVAPYEIEWAKHGVNPGQVLTNYIAWEKDFHENPHKVIGELMSQKGISLEDLTANKDSIPNPEVVELRKKIELLEGKTEEVQNNSIAEYNHSLNNTIESFANEVGTDGKSIRPYFNTVYSHMVPIAKFYRDANPDAPERLILDKAYEEALWHHPEVKQKMLDAEFEKREASKKQTDSDRVQRARIAGSSLSGTPNGSTMVNTKPGSLRETIERAWDELS